MAELTDSYCERCGARYAFSASGQRGLSLKGARVLAKGLKNFVLNDGQSMGDSLTSARLEDDSGDSTRITEAFHKAFNFCMTCRQYACDQCWNEQVGACLSCAPQAGGAAVAREGHLIVRTPVARWDPEWLNFSDSEVDSPSDGDTPSLPTGWPGPLQIDSIRAPQPRTEYIPVAADEPRPPRAAAPTTAESAASWPAIDLVEAGPLPAEPAEKAGRGSRKARDQNAYSLWPAADELAPEMTLTPEEMMLVQAELRHPEPDGTAAETTSAPPERSRVESAVEARPRPAALAPAQMVEAEPTTAPRRVPPVATTPVSPVPHVAERHEPAEPSGIVTRLLGRHHDGDGDRPPRKRKSFAAGAAPSEPWPHATPWADGPLSARHWWGSSTNDLSAVTVQPGLDTAPEYEFLEDLAIDAVAAGTAEPVPPTTAPSPASADVSYEEPVKLRRKSDSAAAVGEARTAATMRQSVIRAAGADTVDVTAMDPIGLLVPPAWSAPPEAPDENTDADAEVAAEVAGIPPRNFVAPPDVAATAEREDPADSPASHAQWPPLGASWPAQDARADRWTTMGAPHPAVVAARQAREPLEAEMWAQSAQEVMNRGTVRVCHHCALPVSTQARFCRRCGTEQA